MRQRLLNLPLLGALFEAEPDLPALAANRAAFAPRTGGLDLSRPLEECVFSVVDTELTGMDPSQDEIVSIGAVRVKNMRIDPSDCYQVLVRPEMALPKLSTLIHRITPEAVQDAPHLAEVLPGFITWLGDTLMVGHHIGMDMSFLNRACRRFYGAGLKTPCLDTMRLAQAFQEDQWAYKDDAFNLKISYKLNHLAEAYGLPVLPEHDAFSDALQAAYLFLFLSRKLRRGRIRTLKDLHLAGKPRRFT